MGTGQEAEIELLLIEKSDADAGLFREIARDVATLAEPVRLRVRHARSLAEGRDAVAERPPQVVVLDLDLPDSRGVASYRGIAAVAGNAPVVILSASADLEVAWRALEAGADDFLVKAGLNADLLKRALLFAIERRAFAREIAARNERFRALVESSGDCIVVVAGDDRIRYANPAAGRIFGLAREALIGQRLEVPRGCDGIVDLKVAIGGVERTLEAAASEGEWDGEQARICRLRDVTTKVRTEAILQQLAQGLAATTGASFVESAACYLGRELGAERVLIGELTEPGQIASVALAHHGRIVDGIAFEIAGSALADALERGTCCQPQGAADRYPDDAMLAEWGATGCVATRLIDSHGAPLGALALYWRDRPEAPELACSVAEIFASRTGAELERVRQERRLCEQRTFLQAVLDGVPDPVMVINRDFRIRLLNRAARELRGQGCVGDPCNAIALHCRPLQEGECVGEACFRSGRVETRESFYVDETGERRWVEVQGAPLLGASGAVAQVIETVRDITARKRFERRIMRQAERLAYMARHDPLSGLPNRHLFNDRLEHALARAGRRDEQVALLFVDLDGFKQINDTFGHGIGDRLLAEVAIRLRHCVRSADTVARIGGDEFVVLLEQIAGVDAARAVADKMVRELREVYFLAGHKLFTGASIGLALFPDHGDEGATLLRHADTAMYFAKRDGGGRCRVYSDAMARRAAGYLSIEVHLHNALVRDEFYLEYQPLVALASGEWRGVEALVRWHHPVRGELTPSEFIAVAEESGMILEIGDWVIENACRDFRHWIDARIAPPLLSINLSPAQFHDPRLVERVSAALARNRIPPERIQLELGEAVLATDNTTAQTTLEELHELGVRLAIDDFGSGRTSLGALRRLPVSRLKIDRSFIHELGRDANASAIVAAIIELGRTLGLEVVAKGVEQVDQVDFLLDRGCGDGQGFLYSAPLGNNEVTRRLTSGEAHARAAG